MAVAISILMVIATEMSQFVSQYSFQFFIVQGVDQCVEKHDALVVAQAGEVGVAVARAFGAVHDEDAVAAKAATGKQTLNPVF